MKGIQTALTQVKQGNPKAVGEDIIRAVNLHCAGQNPVDDVTLVCFGRMDA
jgi:hypothetical protein